jgi:hypothetical protein
VAKKLKRKENIPLVGMMLVLKKGSSTIKEEEKKGDLPETRSSNLGADTQDQNSEEQILEDSQSKSERRRSSNVYIGQRDTIKENMVWNLMEKGQ